jgi:hypothetical protein
MRRGVAVAGVVLVLTLVHATQSRANDIVNVRAIVQATKTAVTNGRVVPGATFTVDHLSIVNDVFALAQWSWGQGASQKIFINDGKPGTPQWTVIGGGGGMVDAKTLQTEYDVDPPYNTPLANGMFHCASADRQPIVPGMSPDGTACSAHVTAPDYGAPRDSGAAADVAAVRRVTLAAGKARGWLIKSSNVFVADVVDGFAVAWVGYKGAIGAVLTKKNDSWRVLNWNAQWGGGDPLRDQLMESGASLAAATALASLLTPHESPQVQGWNKHIQAGNAAALDDDMTVAIREYKTADLYATSSCEHEIIKVSVRSAQETLALVKAGSINADQAGDVYEKRDTKYWVGDPCNRP